MGRVFRFFGRAVGWLGNVQAVYAVIPAGILSATSGVSGYLSSGLGWAIFMASGVFLFVALGIVLIRESYRANRLEHKLTVTWVGIEQFPKLDVGNMLRPRFVIANQANFELFFEISDVDYVFGSAKGVLDKTLPLKGLLSPRETTTILIPGALGSLPIPIGRILIKIRYGREKNELACELSTTLECAPLTVLPPDAGGTLDTSRLVKSLDYASVRIS